MALKNKLQLPYAIRKRNGRTDYMKGTLLIDVLKIDISLDIG